MTISFNQIYLFAIKVITQLSLLEIKIVLDITLISDILLNQLEAWKLGVKHSFSDHRYIELTITLSFRREHYKSRTKQKTPNRKLTCSTDACTQRSRTR